MAPVRPRFAALDGVATVGLIASLILALVLVGELLVARSYYTGTNGAGSVGPVFSVPAGQRLCIGGLEVPGGTARLRIQVARAAVPTTVIAHTTVGATTTPQALAVPGGTGAVNLDLPATARSADAPLAAGSVCVTPSGGPLVVGGRAGLQTGQTAPTLAGHPIADRLMVWYLPAAGAKRSLIAAFGDVARRAALFRPGIVGPWTYWLIIALLPALAAVALRLMIRAARGTWPAHAGLTIAALAFALSACWALVTPPLNAPDENEHVAYAQDIAERGRAPAEHLGPRRPYSSELQAAYESEDVAGEIQQRTGRPPWKALDERRWEQRVARTAPRGDDGGGIVTTAPYSPLYYTAMAGAYLPFAGSSIWTRITAMRLLTAALGSLVALCAFLIVRELLPRDPWAAVGAGLIVAFHPLLSFTAGAVDNDTAVNALAALTLWLLIRGLRRGLTARLAVALGLALIAAPYAKGSGAFLFPAAVVGIVIMVRRLPSGKRLARLGALAGAAGVAIVAFAGLALAVGHGASPLHGGLQPQVQNAYPPLASDHGLDSPLRAITHPWSFVSYTWEQFLPRLPGMADLSAHPYRVPAFNEYVQRGWASFGQVAVLFPNWVYDLIALAIVGTGVATLVALRRHAAAARARAAEITVLALAALGVFLGVQATFVDTGPGPHLLTYGRYLFPAAAALACLPVVASLAVGRRRAPAVALTIVTAMIGLELASFLLAFQGFYR